METPIENLSRIARRLRRGEAVVAGVLSGTSGDGIDVGLCRFAASGGGDVGAPSLLAFETFPFPLRLAPRVRAVLDGAPLSLREVARLSRDLGRAFGGAARELAEREGLRLDLVGSHGQTGFHHDGDGDGDGEQETGAATLQRGEPDEIAVATGVPTVADFRPRDIAAGGEGAPLSALADPLLFASLPRPAAILNLGGIANLTLLPAAGEALLSFDTGPANCLLDGLARRLLGEPFDRGGECARRGRVVGRLLEEFLDHPFFARKPPKSTGRDTFGEEWVSRFVARREGAGDADLLATGVELVAASVADALAGTGREGFDRLVLAGGGARNRALKTALERRLGLETISSSAVGVDPDAREALLFAVLAARALLGRPSTEPSATGAERGHVLGKISLAPPGESVAGTPPTG
jgi:anhydro-N-acetylmuramic acid kinase